MIRTPKRTSECGTVWDTIYAKEGYEKDPDHELVALVKSLPPGKALDVGAGEGRHTLWMASQGWIVDAIDISSVGIATLQQQAEAYGLHVNCWVGSAADQDFGKEAYDLVISTGAVLNFFPKAQSKQIIERMKSAVKPRGFIYVTLTTVEDPAYQRHRKQATDVEDDSFFVEASNAGDSDAVLMGLALARVNIRQYFHHLWTSRELGARKPDPDFYRGILQRLEVEPHACLVVGNDYQKDIVPAKAVGMHTIWFSETPIVPPAPCADAVIHSMDDLIAVIVT